MHGVAEERRISKFVSAVTLNLQFANCNLKFTDSEDLLTYGVVWRGASRLHDNGPGDGEYKISDLEYSTCLTRFVHESLSFHCFSPFLKSPFYKCPLTSLFPAIKILPQHQKAAKYGSLKY